MTTFKFGKFLESKSVIADVGTHPTVNRCAKLLRRLKPGLMPPGSPVPEVAYYMNADWMERTVYFDSALNPLNAFSDWDGSRPDRRPKSAVLSDGAKYLLENFDRLQKNELMSTERLP